MNVDKHSHDAMAKLYAEWVSAGVKLSVAGFAATTKIMEAATQSIVSARAKAPAAPKAETAPVPQARPATPAALKIVPMVARPEPVAAVHEVVKQADAAKVDLAPVAAPSVVAAAPALMAVPQDDLKAISGIGPKLQQMLNRKGIGSFAQIAALGSEGVAKLDTELNLNGRIQRDDWVGQAAKLAGNVGGQTWQN